MSFKITEGMWVKLMAMFKKQKSRLDKWVSKSKVQEDNITACRQEVRELKSLAEGLRRQVCKIDEQLQELRTQSFKP